MEIDPKELVRHAKHASYQVAYGMPRELVEDVQSDTVAFLLRRLPSVHNVRNPVGYVRAAARNKAHDSMRVHLRHASHRIHDSEFVLATNPPVQRESEVFGRVDLEQALERLLPLLTNEEEIMLQGFYEGLRPFQVRERMTRLSGGTNSTNRTRLHRIRLSLQAKAESCGLTPEFFQ